MFPPRRNPVTDVLAIVIFILELILAGLNREEAISRAAKVFGMPEDEFRNLV